MNVIIKSSNGVSTVTLESKLLCLHRKVFLTGEITDEKAIQFVKEIMYLTSEDSSKSIDVIIDSEGGSVIAGNIILDVLQSCNVPIRLIIAGKCYSMAAVIFICSGKKRYMLPSSKIMIHQPSLVSSVGGDSESLKIISDSLAETKDNMKQMLVKYTGQLEETIEWCLGRDYFMNAEQAVKFGAADKVINYMEVMEVINE